MDWFRMYGEFATDPKVQMMSEADQRRFVMLLCLRCSNDGVTLHETEIAFQMRITDEQWIATKALFLAKGLIDEECRITAWDKRQFTSDSSKSRVAKHREKKKQARNVTVTPPDTDTDTDTYIPPPYAHDAFDSRTKFAMPENWEPNPKTFPAVLLQLGIPKAEIDQDQFLEFRSFWLTEPDTCRTQAKWEHALASHLKRNLTEQAGRTTHGSQGPGQAKTSQRPAGKRSLSAVEQVDQAIAGQRAARDVAGYSAQDRTAGTTLADDDGDLRPPLDVEFWRVAETGPCMGEAPDGPEWSPDRERPGPDE